MGLQVPTGLADADQLIEIGVVELPLRKPADVRARVDEDAEAAWATEVNRRLAELDSGAVKTIPWAEVRRRLAAG